MKAINANPTKIVEVFQNNYIIPIYQRPYSWEKEQCETLFSDIIDFYDTNPSNLDSYFLGNIVIYKDQSQPNNFFVIDGQQRLTSISLLLKALFQRANTFKVIEECLRKKDPLTSSLTNELRINSMVKNPSMPLTDKEYFSSIINNTHVGNGNSTFEVNYNVFVKKIDDWISNKTADEFTRLVTLFLYQVVILPISCDSEDDSLLLFETLNNRGLALTDPDIFKAKLYQNIEKIVHQNNGVDIELVDPDQEQKFINTWNALGGKPSLKAKDNNLEWLFRLYMHVLRARDNDSSKEGSIRKFFSENDRLSDWKTALFNLSKIHWAEQNFFCQSKTMALIAILNAYPNKIWHYPLHVFIFKNMWNESNELLEEQPLNVVDVDGHRAVIDDFSKNCKCEEFHDLLVETLKFFYIKGVVHNSINAVKDTAFKVCASIYNAQGSCDYKKLYKDNISDEDLQLFQQRINGNTEHFARYKKGLIFLAAYLNQPSDDMDNLKKLFFDGKGAEIEHILPKKWNNYDRWTQQTHNESLEKLGNLTPIEKELNISASNEFFSRKISSYQGMNTQGVQKRSPTVVQDVKDLCKLDNWYPENFEERNKVVIKRLTTFFKY